MTFAYYYAGNFTKLPYAKKRGGCDVDINYYLRSWIYVVL
jgi:hypothetical protein